MCSWSRADSRVIRAGRMRCFVCRQRVMSCVFARLSTRCRIVSCIVNLPRVESLVLIELLI
jgi:hypothetical protein